MAVMALVADVRPDVVQQRAILEPFALARAEAMLLLGCVEHRQCQPRHLGGVRGIVVVPLGELDDASASHVRVTLDRADVSRVSLDVVEDEPLAEREVTERQLGRAEALQ